MQKELILGFLTSLNCTMLTGQITCAQKVGIQGKNRNKQRNKNKQKTKTKQNHITGQLPASLQF